MVHTFTLRYELTREKYNNLEKLLQEYVSRRKAQGNPVKCFTSHKQGKNYHSYSYIITNGLKLITYRHTSDIYRRLGVMLEINMATLLYGINLFRITQFADISGATQKINKYLSQIGIDFTFDEFDVKRIDYALNLNLETRELVEKYMALLKKYNDMYPYKEKMVRCTYRHRNVPYDNSIYLVHNSRTINIYMKEPHVNNIKERRQYYLPDTHIDENLIRFELQTFYRSLKHIMHRESFSSLKPSSFLSEELSYDELGKVIKKLFLKGDYFRIDIARQIIEKSSVKSKHKELMLEFIERTTRKSIRDVKSELFKEGYSIRQINKALKKFDELNVNPVTIPKSWCISKLSGVYHMLFPYES